MGTKFTVTLKQEVYHRVEISVDDFTNGESSSIEDTCDLYHRIANNPMSFMTEDNYATKESGEIQNVSIEVCE